VPLLTSKACRSGWQPSNQAGQSYSRFRASTMERRGFPKKSLRDFRILRSRIDCGGRGNKFSMTPSSRQVHATASESNTIKGRSCLTTYSEGKKTAIKHAESALSKSLDQSLRYPWPQSWSASRTFIVDELHKNTAPAMNKTQDAQDIVAMLYPWLQSM